MKREDLCEKAFQAAMERFKQKTDMLAAVDQPVIKQVYEAQGHMYENIMVILFLTSMMDFHPGSKRLLRNEKAVPDREGREGHIMPHTIDEAERELVLNSWTS